MNTAQLLEKLHNSNVNVQVDGCYLEVTYNKHKPLTETQLKYLKQHKQEIIQYLQPTNQPRYFRYTYRFTLKNNKGGGTYITNCPPDEVEKELLDRFIGRDIESLNLIN